MVTKISEFDTSAYLDNEEVIAEYLTAALEDAALRLDALLFTPKLCGGAAVLTVVHDPRRAFHHNPERMTRPRRRRAGDCLDVAGLDPAYP